VTVEPTTSGEDLTRMMLDNVIKSGDHPDESTIRLSNQPPGPNSQQLELSALIGRTVSDMGFRWVTIAPDVNQAHESHGDMLFLSYKTQSADPSSHPTTQPSTSTSHPAQPDPSHPHTHTDPPLPNTIPLKDLSNVEEMPVDKYYRSQTGKIERKRDPVLCRHGEKAMCEYCMPLEVRSLSYTVLYSEAHV